MRKPDGSNNDRAALCASDEVVYCRVRSMADDLSKSLASLRIDRSAPPPRRGPPRVLLWLVGLGALVGAGALLYPRLEAKIFKTAVRVTEVSSVSPSQATVELTATGYVQAAKNSRIAPKVPGRVLDVFVVQGQKVKAGEALLELDPTDDEANILAAQSRVAAAVAQARSAEARVSTAEADLLEAKQKAARERRLADTGASTAAAADDLEARVTTLAETVKAQSAAAKAASAEAAALAAQVKVLQIGLKNLTLTSPIDGTIVNKPPQAGEFIGPQPAGISVDMGGVRVADFSTLQVETDIPEGRLSLVKVGAPAEIVLDAYPSQRFRGRVKEITPQIDRAKATVIVKVEFVDATEGVLPDMAARVSFLSQELDAEALKAPPKIIVPASAVVERGGSRVVFVVDDGVARMVPVKLGPPFGASFELESGPSAGTQIVAEPPATLADGLKVKLEDGP